MKLNHLVTKYIVIALLLALGGCSVRTESGSESNTESQAQENTENQPAEQPTQQPAAPAPAENTASVAPAPTGNVDLTASRLTKALADVDQDDLRTALESGGWTVGSATATRSSMLAINITATKGDVTARIKYYNPGGSFWERRLTSDNAAIHKQGEILVGVVIEGNTEGAQTLLNSLVGS